MQKVFIPFKCESPIAIDVKGHRVLIVASKPEDLVEFEHLLGGEEIRELQYKESAQGALQYLAKLVNGGVVLAPPGVGISAMISSLEHELPWIH